MEPPATYKRVHVTIDTSVKGIHTPRISIEYQGPEADLGWLPIVDEAVLAMEELDRRYPIIEGK
jgi:hypothetical protein